MERDAQFDGVEHDSLPSVSLDFSVKSAGRANQPEVVVDVKKGGEWVRLPVTRVETRVNKDGPADLSTTSRVDVPVTWGRTPNGDEKIPIYEYVGQSRSDVEIDPNLPGSDGTIDPTFDLARVFYWNQYNSTYSVEQFGYVASIGPGDQNGTFRFYIYDTSDLMKNISVTKTYDSPTAKGVANFVAFDENYGIDNNTPVPIEKVSTTVPAENVDIVGSVESFDKEVAGWLGENIPILKSDDVDTFKLMATAAGGTNNFLLEDALEFVSENEEWLDDELHSGGHKHFRKNRHTLVDVMNWLTEEIGGSWYFEPLDEGVVLVVNNGAANDYNIARSSYYGGQFDPSEFDYIAGYNPARVDIVHNTSLEDLKPINFLELNGESQASFLGINRDRIDLDGPLGAARGHTDEYPHIEVTYPPLLDRTGGNKLGPSPIESGKQTIAEAEQEAVKKFKEAHEDNTDGSITIQALPPIRPYDYIAAVPVCNNTFDASMNPIQYEVNSVVHSASAAEPYTTSLGVSMALIEDKIETTPSSLEVNPDE